MANTGRYIFTPAAGRIKGNRNTLADWFHFWKIRRQERKADLFEVTGYLPAYYPQGYKK